MNSRKRRHRSAIEGTRIDLSWMIDFLPDPTFAIDLSGKVIVWNKAMEEMTGVKAAYMLGKGNYEYSLSFYGTRRPMLLDLVLDDSLEIGKTYLSLERRGDTTLAENDIMTPKGQARLAGRASPIYDESGEIVGAIQTMRDVTAYERAKEAIRRSEETYRAIFENTGTAMVIVGKDNVISLVNTEFEKLSGYGRTEVEHIIDWPFFALEEDRERMLAIHNQRKQDPYHAVKSYEGRFRNKLGDVRDIYLTVDVIPGTDLFVASIIDITEKKRVEARLKWERNFTNTLVKTSPAFIIALTPDWRIIMINDAVSAAMGYVLEDVRGKNFLDFVSPEGQETVSRIFFSMIEQKVPAVNITPTIIKDGSVLLIEWHGRPVFDENGNVDYAFAIGIDITERKRIEESLKASEARYRDIFENVSDFLYVHDLKGNIIDSNLPFKEGFGYAKEDVIGMNIRDFITARARSGYDQYLEKIIRDGYDEGISEVKTKDGGFGVIEYRDSLVRDENGTPVAIRGSSREITERVRMENKLRRSEERFRRLFEDSADATLLIENSRFVDCNRAASEMLKLYSKDQILGKHPGEVSPVFQPDGQPSLRKADEIISQVMEKGSLRFEWVHTRADGADFPAEVVLTAITLGDKTLMYTTCRDITEKKKAEEEHRVYEARLARSQKLEAIGTLAGGIAHDFNNILSAIIGFTELALDDVAPGSHTYSCLQEVITGGDRAKDLVSQILTFSRQALAEKKVIHVGVILKEAMKLLRSSIPSTISIVLRTDPDVPPVFADPTQIHQVIMNLCTNAYQAMMETGGTITVTLGQEEIKGESSMHDSPLMPGRYAAIIVEDTGTGMDSETMNRIFEPFFTTKEKGRGTGLGLSTVHGIVTELKGAVQVKSRLGAGSTFSIHIPACEDMDQDTSAKEESSPRGNGERILVVDDETAILEFLKDMLQQMGYRITTTPSSVDALDLFTRSPGDFDLVFTDQTMPVMTGADLAKELLSIRPDIPVILATGFSETVSADDALSRGIRVYLEKPFTRTAISNAIRRALVQADETP